MEAISHEELQNLNRVNLEENIPQNQPENINPPSGAVILNLNHINFSQNNYSSKEFDVPPPLEGENV